MELENLPIVDWNQATQLAGNKKELAKELLLLLINGLPKELSEIKKLHQNNDYRNLLQHVHKLHGALCYCGVPRLKTIIEHMEIELKKRTNPPLSSLLSQLDKEVTLLIKQQI